MEYGSGTTPHFQEVDQVRCEVCDGLSLHLKERLSPASAPTSVDLQTGDRKCSYLSSVDLLIHCFYLYVYIHCLIKEQSDFLHGFGTLCQVEFINC